MEQRQHIKVGKQVGLFILKTFLTFYIMQMLELTRKLLEKHGLNIENYTPEQKKDFFNGLYALLNASGFVELESFGKFLIDCSNMNIDDLDDIRAEFDFMN